MNVNLNVKMFTRAKHCFSLKWASVLLLKRVLFYLQLHLQSVNAAFIHILRQHCGELCHRQISYPFN